MEPDTKTYIIEADGRQPARNKARAKAREEGLSLKIRKMKTLTKDKKWEITGIVKKRKPKKNKKVIKQSALPPKGDKPGVKKVSKNAPKGKNTAPKKPSKGSKKKGKIK